MDFCPGPVSKFMGRDDFRTEGKHAASGRYGHLINAATLTIMTFSITTLSTITFSMIILNVNLVTGFDRFYQNRSDAYTIKLPP